MDELTVFTSLGSWKTPVYDDISPFDRVEINYMLQMLSRLDSYT